MNVYLIRQDPSHLYGDILESAVVIAESVNEAVQTLSSHLANDEITWDRSLWAITRLGNNAKYPPQPFGPVVCKRIYNKQGLPPGNYQLRKHDYAG